MSDLELLYPIARTGTQDAPYLLVGEAPNAATERLPGLWLHPDSSGIAHAANRLLEYTGRERREYLRTFDRTNLMRRAKFGKREARAACLERLDQWSGRRLLLLGQKVADAFAHLDGRQAGDLPLLEWRRFSGAYCGGGRARLVVERQARRGPRFGPGFGKSPMYVQPFDVAVVPHPSGCCRWWNTEANRARARAFFDTLDWS